MSRMDGQIEWVIYQTTQFIVFILSMNETEKFLNFELFSYFYDLS